MTRVVIFLCLFCFILTGCGKEIVFGGHSIDSGDYGYNTTIIKKNNSSNYSNSVSTINNGSDNVITQSDINNNKIIQTKSDNSENILNLNADYKKNNKNDDILANAMYNNTSKTSSLLQQDIEKGQIDLSSREQFSDVKNKNTSNTFDTNNLSTDNNGNNKNGYNTINNQNGDKNNNPVAGCNNLNSACKCNCDEKQKVKYSINDDEDEFLQNQNLEKKRIERKSYKIQCGNYFNKKAAEMVLNKLKSNGIKDVKIVSEDGSHRILVGDFDDKIDGAELFQKIKELDLKDEIFWSYR